MSKKFDVVIGNPPYQEDAEGTATHGKPIYHLFMDAAHEVSQTAVLVTPARFLFNAGYTPKAWNAKMLSDRHLSVAYYFPDSDDLFPGTDIKGGVAVTYRDTSKEGNPIGTFSKFAELSAIVRKVNRLTSESLAYQMTSSRSYRYTDAMHKDHPNAASLMAKGEQYKINTKTFQQLDFLYEREKPVNDQEYVRVYGLAERGREYRWIKRDYIAGPESLFSYKVVMPKANGSGKLGEVISSPEVLDPCVATTQTFLTVGAYEERDTAEACLKYIKSKFARALLGVLKITHDNPAKVWKHVPLQDFSTNSDIDWSKSISEIDQQLYAKYALDDDEIAFIESIVKPMD